MPSLRFSHIAIFLVICSLTGIIIVLTLNVINKNRCIYVDKRICNFLNKYKKIPYRYAAGKIDLTIACNLYKGNWTISNDIEEFSLLKDNTPALIMVLSNQFIYLKDNKSDNWWRQSQADARQYNIEIPFNPFSFFRDIKYLHADEKTQPVYIQSLACGSKQCFRYQLKNSDKEEQQQFLYITQDDFTLYRSVLVQGDKVIDVTVNSYEKQQIEPPKNIIEMTSNQNIFLEWTKQQSQSEKNLEYLNEFQQERQEAEGQNSPQILQATPTAIVTSP